MTHGSPDVLHRRQPRRTRHGAWWSRTQRYKTELSVTPRAIGRTAAGQTRLCSTAKRVAALRVVTSSLL
jgi:hypothetical protein